MALRGIDARGEDALDRVDGANNIDGNLSLLLTGMELLEMMARLSQLTIRRRTELKTVHSAKRDP